MSDINEELAYLYNQLKKGILVGAGLTLFSSGIIIGIKTASIIINIASGISSDGVTILRNKANSVVKEDKHE